MQENNYNLGIRPFDKEVCSAGIAYVVIPSDVDREKYIQDSLRNCTVSIYSEQNGFCNRAHVSKIDIGFIDFPESINEFGSAVSYVTEPIHKLPIITGVYNRLDQGNDLKEYQFSFKRAFNGNTVEITGTPKENYLAVNLYAKQGGKVILNVVSEDNSGTLEIQVNGNTEVKSTNNTTFTQYNEFTSVTVNEDDDQFSAFKQDSKSHTFFDEEHSVNTHKFTINQGDQPFILGKKWMEYEKKKLQLISQITTTTALGQMPILNKEAFIKLKDEVDELLSEIAFLDR